ncbi:MAG TPA: CinA family protein [Afipia sp.]|uniref:CinA family protein n=1 Tax=unclassified Afipia TaxID=2642050 RepID=UPI0004643079|nr:MULTISPECIES: CinA family protein [unclassified Afipia]MAH71987.1 CinA family protein [Afipia sp.]OUX59016.1 MAG: CinA family protein [Afipia sp. TMED4]HAO41982.1 CinA family protein [Afipia sp.]HAP11776.1 CinA family protein [Afipia sp.]HAP48877.1 CinA family protein [Afipia sp.]
MEKLLPLAEKIAASLIARKETIAVAESSTGGLISAALLSVPGASAYYRGGGVIYTPRARAALVNITKEEMEAIGMRGATEPYATLLANRARELLNTTWGLSETGATGPSGNRYGDAAGHSCMAVAGPLARVITLETGDSNRIANMRAFALRSLELFAETMDSAR